MTTNGKEIQLPANAAGPERVGQGTLVEQSRAIAEVQGAIIVAQRVPRNVAVATNAMRESCGQKFLAEKAFFSYKRAGSVIAGLSVYLARELARCWGNVQYGVDELRRDDEHGQSEMLAWAWDVQTNTRVSTKFIVPHMRDKTGGPVKLTDMRDIYENNANAGARRVRECIVNILPPWFVDEAKELCTKTVRDGGGVPLPKRISDTIVNFARLGVTQQQLEKRQGRGTNAWTEMDVAQLHVIGRSLQNGEIQRDEAFEPDLPSATEFPDLEVKPAVATAQPSVPSQAAAQPEAPGEGVTSDKPTREQISALLTLLNDNGVSDQPGQIAVVSLLVDSRVDGIGSLTGDEVVYLLKRIPELVEAGSFAGSVERARKMVEG